jgi:hypothetical protein
MSWGFRSDAHYYHSMKSGRDAEKDKADEKRKANFVGQAAIDQ